MFVYGNFNVAKDQGYRLEARIIEAVYTLSKNPLQSYEIDV